MGITNILRIIPQIIIDRLSQVIDEDKLLTFNLIHNPPKTFFIIYRIVIQYLVHLYQRGLLSLHLKLFEFIQAVYQRFIREFVVTRIIS
jgi:hypothetical protein